MPVERSIAIRRARAGSAVRTGQKGRVGVGVGEVFGILGVACLMAASGCRAELEPPVPQLLGAAVTVHPQTVAPGAFVTVQATGLRGSSTVQVGFGRHGSDYDVIHQGRTDASGSITAQLPVPTWASRGGAYVLVVREPSTGVRVVSDPFVVAEQGDPIAVEGTLRLRA